MRCIKLL